MQGAKQKVKDMASAAKHHAQIYEAKVEEQAEKATARTREEREIATERRKVKEAEAKAELHASKAHHAAEKLEAKRQPLHIPGVGAANHHYPAGVPAGAVAGFPETTGHVGVAPHQPVGTHYVPDAGVYPPETTTHHHHVPGRRLL
ncbi:hypothetical protein V2J09_004748 [Rumex salicifolius]